MSIKTSIKVDRVLYAELKKLSVLKGRDISDLINDAIRVLLEREGISVA